MKRLVEISEGPREDGGFIVVLAFIQHEDGWITEEELFYDSFYDAYGDMADLAEGLMVEWGSDEDEFLTEEEESIYDQN